MSTKTKEAAEGEVQAEEKKPRRPAPRRAKTTKTTAVPPQESTPAPSEPPTAPPATAAATATADEPAKKPARKRTRTPAKKKSPPAPGESVSETPVEPAAKAAPAAEPTPAAKQTPARAETPPAEPAGEEVKKPARKRNRSSAKKKAAAASTATQPESAAPVEPAAASAPAASAPPPPAVEAAAEDRAEGSTDLPAGEPVKKPGRKRKRGSAKKRASQAAAHAAAEEHSPSAAEPETAAPSEQPPVDSQETSSPERSADEPVKRTGRKRKRGSGRKKAGQVGAQPTSTVKSEPTPETDVEEMEDESTAETDSSPLSLKLLINAEEPEECRVALLENGKLESFHVETISREQHKGNIYKGRIVSLETNLQAAFVDLGTGKNGFLPFNEIHPEYYRKELPADTPRKGSRIKEVLAEGQEVLVEVVKDVTGNKGASLTTFLSLPGRYVVLMPGSDSHGISKKIDKEEERQKLREMLAACNIPEGVGYIIRTASAGITKTALTNDVKYQIKLWEEIREKAQSEPTPALLYKEQSIIDRFLRDHYSVDIGEILVDSQEAYDQVMSFLALLPAAQRKKTTARLHKGPRPLLNSYNIEEQIEQIFRPTVKLPSGGSIVINPTEALVAIDVNSGSTGRDKNFEDTIFLANMEAAEELARQLRLRDLGGLIVVDFIDMRPMSHIKEVEKKVKSSMKRDKAKVDFTRISKFGLMEISRQRMGAPIQTGNYQPCQYCQGHGMVRSVETQALAFLRQIQTGITRKNIAVVRCLLPMEVGKYLLNKKRADLVELERDYKASIIIDTEPTLKPSEAKIEFIKEQR